MPKRWKAWSAPRRWRRTCPSLDQRRIDRLYQLGRYEECLVLYRKLLDRNPADVPLHQAYNSLLYRLGRKDEYLASYDRAPQTREILLGKARLLSLQKRSRRSAGHLSTRCWRAIRSTCAALAGWADNLMARGATAKRWRSSRAC